MQRRLRYRATVLLLQAYVDGVLSEHLVRRIARISELRGFGKNK